MNNKTSKTYAVYYGSNSNYASIITYSLNQNAPVIISGKQFPDYSVGTGHFVIVTAYYYEGPGVRIMCDAENNTVSVQTTSDDDIADTTTYTLKFRYYDPHYQYYGNKWVTGSQLYGIVNSYPNGEGKIVGLYYSAYSPITGM